MSAKHKSFIRTYLRVGGLRSALRSNCAIGCLIVLLLGAVCWALALMSWHVGADAAEAVPVAVAASAVYVVVSAGCAAGSILSDFTPGRRAYLRYLGLGASARSRLGAALCVPAGAAAAFGSLGLALMAGGGTALALCAVAAVATVSAGAVALAVAPVAPLAGSRRTWGAVGDVCLRGRFRALVFSYVRGVGRLDVVFGVVMAAAVLFVALRLSAPAVLLLAVCRLSCAGLLVGFLAVGDRAERRAAARYYATSPRERAWAAALPSAALLAVAVAVGVVAASGGALAAAALLAYAVLFAFCWSAWLDSSLRGRRATPGWQLAVTLLAAVPAVPWVLGAAAMLKWRRDPCSR